eukprot:CAMPEP_0205921590 /NCGR_PEP_ID=MMETSP1325-20131115/13092_1 /ASSEMBLY_ACC=CAM_ASM_000708 /TAXON_ID=236786 /ORGANISM="Florenciella sp., Strain RCC1007" /LENGTH=55 /DNA_ID=CAMNT_0053289447 /DNA_START=532 /DNA_END=699 /DNA_ORIENTATION=-
MSARGDMTPRGERCDDGSEKAGAFMSATGRGLLRDCTLSTLGEAWERGSAACDFA